MVDCHFVITEAVLVVLGQTSISWPGFDSEIMSCGLLVCFFNDGILCLYTVTFLARTQAILLKAQTCEQRDQNQTRTY